MTQLLAGGPDEQNYAFGSMRGADGYWHWLLGSNRLAINELAGGQQPYRDEGSELVAVFNGEIYNHRSLRARLRSKYSFKDNCDGRVILPLYAEHGDAYQKYLDGMYAVAVFDKRKRRLVLSADPVGIKPLYYHWNESTETLYFASEIPALLELSGCVREIRPQGIDAYFTARAVYGETTIFKDVFRLRPGTAMVVEPGQNPSIRSHSPAEGRELMPSGDFEIDAALLRELMEEEIRSLLVADVPVATILSGGLDSSLVTAIAARRRPGIHSFHIRYHRPQGEWPADESAYARELAAAVKTIHHEVVADPRDFVDLIPEVAWRVGANADPITLSSKLLFRAVNRAGFKTILSGDGADELFGGYERMAEALGDRCENWAERYVDALAAVSRPLRQQLYTEDFRDYLEREGSVSDLLEERLRCFVKNNDGDLLAGILDFEQTDRLPTYHLARVDTTSMAHGVEVRVPFLQSRIVRFARRLASDQKINDEGVKRLLYRSAAGLISESILRRPKQPFTLPVAAMLAEGQPLYDHARDVLNPRAVGTGGILDGEAVEKLLQSHGKTPTNETGLAIWSLLIFQTLVAEFVGDLGYGMESLRGAGFTGFDSDATIRE